MLTHSLLGFTTPIAQSRRPHNKIQLSASLYVCYIIKTHPHLGLGLEGAGHLLTSSLEPLVQAQVLGRNDQRANVPTRRSRLRMRACSWDRGQTKVWTSQSQDGA